MASADRNSSPFVVDQIHQSAVPLSSGMEYVPVQQGAKEVIMVARRPMEVVPMSPDWYPQAQRGLARQPPQAFGTPKARSEPPSDIGTPLRRVAGVPLEVGLMLPGWPPQAQPDMSWQPQSDIGTPRRRVAPMPLEVVPMSPGWPPQAQPDMSWQPPSDIGTPRRRRVARMPLEVVPMSLDPEPEMDGFDDAMGLPSGTCIQNGMSSLPPDASNTIYAEGLPSNYTRRELAHIFRHFTGFREVRISIGNNNNHIIAFVEYATPVQAFSAMQALQGYRLDIQDRHSHRLYLQFSRGRR